MMKRTECCCDGTGFTKSIGRVIILLSFFADVGYVFAMGIMMMMTMSDVFFVVISLGK